MSIDIVATASATAKGAGFIKSISYLCLYVLKILLNKGNGEGNGKGSFS